MTDSATSGASGWVPVIREVAHLSGHELRNALNGLVVNLEVVRSRAGDGGGDAPPVASFLAQAVSQAEESVRLAEATLALLELVLGAVGDRGELRCELISPHSVRVAAAGPEAERALQRLRVLTGAAGVQSEADDSAVILRIPRQSSADTD